MATRNPKSPPRRRKIRDAPLPTDWPALAAAALERALTAPVPVSFRAEWWPAMVQLPDYPTPVRLAKVFVAASGLYVYTARPPIQHRATGGTPHWWARVDFDKTPRPATGYAARDAGVLLVTEAGSVVVQPLGGCGCQNGALRAWRPDWANRNEAWETRP